MRENKEKQALSDLMIKPVQRIPRYELLVKVGMGLGGQEGMGLGGQVGSLEACGNAGDSVAPTQWSRRSQIGKFSLESTHSLFCSSSHCGAPEPDRGG